MSSSESSGSFYLREEGAVRNIYDILLLIECPFHLVTLVLAIFTFTFLLSGKAMIHIHMKIIIGSYIFATILLSISRLAWLILEEFWIPLDVMEIFMYSRFIFQTSVSAHSFAFSAERVIATIQSNKYEKESYSLAIVLSCLLSYPFSFFLLYSKYNFTFGRELNVLVIAVCSLTAIMAMIIINFVNKRRIKQRRWKAKISETYQIRENIRISRLILQIAIIGSFFLGTSCYFLLKFSASLKYPEKVQETITYGFLYDIFVSSGTMLITVVFLNYMIPKSMRNKWILRFNCPCSKKPQSITPNNGLSFKSYHGERVQVGHISFSFTLPFDVVLMMGSFYFREKGAVRNIYEIFLLIECPFHLVTLVLAIFTISLLLSGKAMVHKHMKIIIGSYIFATSMLSFSRLIWLILEEFWAPLNVMEIFMFIRTIFQNSVSAHLFAFSAERVVATLQSNKYEKESCSFIIFLSCFLSYPYASFLIYLKYNSTFGRELNVLMIAICSFTAITTMIIVYFANKKRIKQRRWKAQISETYQIRENIRTSRLILQVATIGSIFLGAACFFILEFSASLKYPEKVQETITYGFIYDILVSTGTMMIIVVFLNYMIPKSKRNKLILRFNCPCSKKPKSITPNNGLSFKSYHGERVQVGRISSEQEAHVYFSQLSNAWK